MVDNPIISVTRGEFKEPLWEGGGGVHEATVGGGQWCTKPIDLGNLNKSECSSIACLCFFYARSDPCR